MHEITRGRRLLRFPSMFIAAALIAATGLSLVPASTALALPHPPPPPVSSICGTYASAVFGPNVCVFTPPSGPTLTATATDLAAIQTVVNNVATQQVPVSAQFNDQGYALLFEPGTYGSATTPLVFQAGYYTEVAGLGAVPQDTIINGQVEVLADQVDCATPSNCWGNSDDNFWRSMSNLTINVMNSSPNNYVPTPITELPPISVTYGGACFDGSTDLWSSSQASPVRSVIINGNLNWQQYCSGANDYSSGSYVANSEINGQLAWSGNQQGIARNTDFQSAAGYVWNYVYSGDACPPGYTPPAGTACSPTEDAFNGSYDIGSGTDGINGVNQVTELPESPVTEEEPFLYTGSNGNWDAFVPAVQQNSVGPNFISGSEAGTSVSLSSFFIANPSTPEFLIQAALNSGHNLVLTPGTYDLNAAITVSRPDTLVIGLGFPVLVPRQGNAALVAVPNNGVKLSGMIVDAGPVNSPVLVSVGTPGSNWGGGWSGADNPNDPDVIQDMYFRVGGAETTAVSATASLLDNASNSIIDDIWAWRADHGANTSVTGPQGQVGAGWTYNQGDTGLAVTGNNVTGYGLAVEHYQKNEIVWSGNNGTVVYLQNELPYDAPSQMAWETSPVQPGYPSFLVTNNVQTFNGYGMASYVVFIYSNATLWDSAAFEAPQNAGVQFTDAMDLFISSTCSVNADCPTPSQSGGDDSVIDGVGGPATSANPTTPVDVDSYVNGVATLP
jgi:hypothetical protein